MMMYARVCVCACVLGVLREASSPAVACVLGVFQERLPPGSPAARPARPRSPAVAYRVIPWMVSIYPRHPKVGGRRPPTFP